MKDRFFFPITASIAVLMVAGALLVDSDKPLCGPVGGAGGPADYSQAVIDGRDLCRMEAALGFDLTQSAPETRGNTLRILAEPGALRDGVEGNAHFTLGPDLETVYAGQTLRMTVTAQPATERGAMAFEINYSTGNAGGSGWQRFDMQPGWKDYTYTFNVPRKLLETAVAFDYFAVRPVVDGDKPRAIEISKIVFDRLGAWED